MAHQLGGHKKLSHDPNSYYPPPLNPADVQCWYTQGRGNRALLHGHRLFGEKLDPLKVEKPERDSKITDNE